MTTHVTPVDPDQLFRVLMNLCRNAVEALESNKDISVVRRLTVEAWRNGGVVTIEVRDTGPGVPERALAHLFQPFQGSARPGGTAAPQSRKDVPGHENVAHRQVVDALHHGGHESQGQAPRPQDAEHLLNGALAARDVLEDVGGEDSIEGPVTEGQAFRVRRDEGHQVSAWWMIGAFVVVSAGVIALMSLVPGGA